MFKSLFCLVLTFGHLETSFSARPKCPDPEDLSPCTCDLEGISCNWVIDGEDLRRSLNVHDGESAYRNFWMVETSVTEIQNSTFKKKSFLNLYLPNNQIHTIQIDAFSGLEDRTKLVELQSNHLREIPLSALKKLKLLNVLVLSKNQIEAIPDGAFTSFSELNEVRLEGNKISHIGKKAFDVEKLREVNLSNNKLIEIGELAFFITSSDAVRLILKLSYNEIEKIAQNAFNGRENNALDNVELKSNGIVYFREEIFSQILRIFNSTIGVELDVSGNMILCDKSMNWITQYPVETRRKIKGIMCLKDGIIVDMFHA